MSHCMKLLLFCWLAAFAVAISVSVKHQQELRLGPAVQSQSCETNTTPEIPDLLNVTYHANVRTTRINGIRTFRYVQYEPRNGKPYLLFLHGFPSSSFDWRHQFGYFSERGYGIIAPDMLGYGGTDRPPALESYRLKTMAAELVQVVNCIAGAQPVVAVSHDFGSLLLSRIVTYSQNRLQAVVFLDIGYQAPGINLGPSSLSTINTLAKYTLGYPIYGYWTFFNKPEATETLDQHPQSISSLIYSGDVEQIKRQFCDPSELEVFIRKDQKAMPSTYMSVEDYATHERITSHGGGYATALNWYRALIQNVNGRDEDAIPGGQASIKKPVLLITADNDPIGLPVLAKASTWWYAQNYRVRSVNASHFLMIQNPAETNRHLHDFLTSL